MASGFPIQSGSNGNLASVDADGNLAVKTPTEINKVGYTGLATVLTDGIAFATNAPKEARRLMASNAGRLKVGTDTQFLDANFIGTAINLSTWSQSSATMTVTVGSGFANLNAGNSVATTVHAQISSYRFFPVYHDFSTRFNCVLQFPVVGQANTTMEWGLFIAATTAAPTDGVFFRQNGLGNLIAVVNFAGTETVLDLNWQFAASTRYEFGIVIDSNEARFYIDGELAGKILVPPAGATSTAATNLPVRFRIYNGGVAPALANQVKISSVAVNIVDTGASRSWREALVGQGANAIQQTWSGGTTGQTANYANSAAPTSATLSNTAAGYTTLGGQWQFAAVAGAETDYALFGYQVPAGTNAVQGKTLYVTGIRIDTYNMGAAVATTPTLLQWGCSAGSTAVTLAGTVDSAGTKVVRRVALGVQSLPVGAAIGASAGNAIDTQFASPLVVNQGEFFHVILKMPVGSATASQIIRGTCFINGYWE